MSKGDRKVIGLGGTSTASGSLSLDLVVSQSESRLPEEMTSCFHPYQTNCTQCRSKLNDGLKMMSELDTLLKGHLPTSPYIEGGLGPQMENQCSRDKWIWWCMPVTLALGGDEVE